MKPLHSALLLLLLSFGVVAQEPARPNVLVFLVDDLGQRDLGCYGSTFYETPNIDRLAKSGMLFSDAYAACPVCSPTRASLMTGLWPQRTGITDYINSGGGNQPKQWNRNTVLLPAPYNDRLSLDSPTLAKVLKRTGYATFFAGKWHLGPEGFWPENQGFDVNQGGVDRGGPYGGKKYFSPYGNPRLTDGPEGEHLPDRLATETNKFIEQHAKKPFFAYLSFYSVHTPLMARDDLRQKYELKRKQMQLQPRWGRDQFRDVRLVQEHAIYAAMVEAMDAAVGKVLTKLEELKLTDNTLILFTSDNGGLSTSEGWPTSNVPWRAGKGWLYEGGIREPLIISWPGKIQKKSTSAFPVSSPDVMPTILEATGAKPLEKQVLDGVSLLPLFSGKELTSRPIFWHYPHYGNQGGAPGAAIRQDQWKLIEWFEDRRTELYDLQNDPSETINLANKHPDIAADLQKKLHQWQLQVDAKLPTINPKYDLAKQNGRIAYRK
ncbi:MAG: sulfatase [Zavarzinella sp.]